MFWNRYGTLGGYIAGPRELVDTVRTYAAGFIFTTSLPPMIAAGAAKSIELLRGPVGVERRAEHQRKSKKLIEMLKKVGIPVRFDTRMLDSGVGVVDV